MNWNRQQKPGLSEPRTPVYWPADHGQCWRAIMAENRAAGELQTEKSAQKKRRFPEGKRRCFDRDT
jgi:hypothetical protein